MMPPEQEQIDHWIKVRKESLRQTQDAIRTGFFEKNNVPSQSIYTGDAISHATLARAKFLNGDPIEEVRAEFAQAARCILKSFRMAYDPADPDYVGDRWPPPNPQYTGKPGSVVEAKWLDPGYGEVNWADVGEVWFIEGIDYALMAADFALAKELAGWFRDRPDGVLMDKEVNDYAHDLKLCVLAAWDEALARLEAHAEYYRAFPPTRNDYRRNYCTLTTALHGIAARDAERFNEGLRMQLEFHAHEAKGELKDTSEEFICDHAVALANLGLHRGLPVTVEDDRLPRGLLIEVG